MRKSRNLPESFGYAASGILYTLKTQRNMRIHFLLAITAAIMGKRVGLETYELMAVFFSIALVMISEMVNTAVESVVDMLTENYHPLAKTAKNVAAGAVLIAAINAVVTGYLVFLRIERLEKLFPGLFL